MLAYRLKKNWRTSRLEIFFTKALIILYGGNSRQRRQNGISLMIFFIIFCIAPLSNKISESGLIRMVRVDPIVLCYLIFHLLLCETIDTIYIDWSYLEIKLQGHDEKVGITLGAIYFDLRQLVVKAFRTFSFKTTPIVQTFCVETMPTIRVNIDLTLFTKTTYVVFP
jgi:hypothetical protein